jgi:type I restriction enzyme, S subunit
MSPLPPGWAVARLDELVESKAAITDGPFGSNLKTEHYTDSGPRVVRLQNIGHGVFLDERAHIHQEHYDRLARHQVEPHDILIATLGEVLPRACTAPESLGPAVVKADCIRARPAPGVSSRYVMHALNSPDVRAAVGRSIQGVGRPRVNLSTVRGIAIPLAPVPEQRRIVDELERRLSHVDAAVGGLRLSFARLAAARRAVLNSVADGSLIEADASVWTDVNAGEVCDVKGGIQKQPRRAPKDNAYPFLRVANVGRGTLDLSEIHEIELFGEELDTYRLAKGDLLVVEGNGSIGHIGRAAMWDGSIEDCVHQNHLIRVRPSADVSPAFLALVWNAPATIAQLVEVASSTSGLHTLSTGKVKSVRLCLPDLATQTALVQEAERRLSLIAAAERTITASLARAGKLRRSLLAAAFSGRLVPQDPDDEPASVLLERIAAERAAAAPVKTPRRKTKTKEPVT